MHENDVIRHDCQFKYVKNNQHIWYDCYRAKDRGENLIVLSEDGKDLLGATLLMVFLLFQKELRP